MGEPAHRASHRIAAHAATRMVEEGHAPGLSWRDIAVSAETALAIVVAGACSMAGRADDTRLAAELIDTITERAQARVTALMLGVPYAG